MNHKLQPVRGTHDILPEEAARRRELLRLFIPLAEGYGYGEFEPPMFEFSEVFHRTLGDSSDIVTKETYTFEDRGGESITLRPEFTAAIARAFISQGMQQHTPLKWWYYGPAFRYERPQKGRQRQFTQIGAELLGAGEPSADVEIMALAYDFLATLGLKDKVVLELNSLGDAQSRQTYRQTLVDYYQAHKQALSEQSRIRLEVNPLRILDSKDEGDRAINAHAPALRDSFTPEATAFFARVCEGLADIGIAYQISDSLVRGLDYYSHSVFEFTTTMLGAQGTVLAGGRYDGLIEMMGGQPTAGVGFAAGVERLLALAESRLQPVKKPLIALVPLGDAAERQAWILAHELRANGLAVDMAYKGNAGKRLKHADKLGAAYAVIMGDDEMAQASAQVKCLADGSQQLVGWDRLHDYLKKVT